MHIFANPLSFKTFQNESKRQPFQKIPGIKWAKIDFAKLDSEGLTSWPAQWVSHRTAELGPHQHDYIMLVRQHIMLVRQFSVDSP